jgi:hypothetical protein
MFNNIQTWSEGYGKYFNDEYQYQLNLKNILEFWSVTRGTWRELVGKNRDQMDSVEINNEN